MDRLIRLVALVMVLALMGGVVWLGTADIPPPAETISKDIPHEKYRR